MDKKGAGLIQGLVMGIAFLVIAVIIAFVIVANIETVHDELDTGTFVKYVTNETVTGTLPASINKTGYTLFYANVTGFYNPQITYLWNSTSNKGLGYFNVSLATSLGSVSSAGVLTNGTGQNYHNVSVSYAYTVKVLTTSVDYISGNFTEGVNKVSEKLPTALLITVIVLIMGILAILWAQYKRMNVGGGNAGKL